MVKFGILDKLELQPIPSLPKGKSDEGIWDEIEKELTRAATPSEQEVFEPISHGKKKAIHIVEYQGKRGAWFTKKPSGRRFFVPLEKIDWRRVTVTPGIANTVVRDILKRDPLTSIFATEIKVTVPVGAQAKLYPQYIGAALNHVTRNKEHLIKTTRSAVVGKIAPEGIYYLPATKEMGGWQSLVVKGKFKDWGGKVAYAVPEKGDFWTFAYLEVRDKGQGKKMFRRLWEMAKELDRPKVRFRAGLQNGSYMWAYLHANWTDKVAERRMKKFLLDRIETERLEPVLKDIVKKARTPFWMVINLEKKVGKQGVKKLFSGLVWDAELNFHQPAVWDWVKKRLERAYLEEAKTLLVALKEEIKRIGQL